MKVVKLTFSLRWKHQCVSPSREILRYRLAFEKRALSPCSDWECSFHISDHSKLISTRFPKCISEYWLSVTFTAWVILKDFLSNGNLVELMSLTWTLIKQRFDQKSFWCFDETELPWWFSGDIYINTQTHTYVSSGYRRPLSKIFFEELCLFKKKFVEPKSFLVLIVCQSHCWGSVYFTVSLLSKSLYLFSGGALNLYQEKHTVRMVNSNVIHLSWLKKF